MSKRITANLDDNVIKNLRILQAKKIKETSAYVSFSEIVNEVLRKSFNPSI